jgi:molybdopterin-guanine dinucleotide biosynthesis protein A
MIKLDGMLMIGSAGANVGKTMLACEILRKFGKDSDIVGIKVTAIKEKDGRCPRGGVGCGVCSSLEGDFCITEETNAKSGKDTARLLAAGARRVFWLRVLKSHLKESLAALLDIIGHDAISICESNSLRHVIEPGLFLVVRGHDSKIWKSSAGDVKKYADRIVVFNGSSFDLDIGRIKLADGKWLLQENAAAIIMAGGSSSRMGADKSMLPVEGRPMIERICGQLRGSFNQILISTNDTDKFAFLGERIVTDKVPGQGPLMGIVSALQVSDNELNFIVACDIPHVNLPFVRRMIAEAKDADIAVPVNRDGKYEPLFAVYNKSALAAINEVLASGRRKISDVFDQCKIKYIELGDADGLVNINTMVEYEKYREKCYGS